MDEAEGCEQLSSRKRTRSNVKQSKYGCFTCKARRIKCDERKPTCRRCECSERVCGGYPNGTPPQILLAEARKIGSSFEGLAIHARISSKLSIASQLSPRDHQRARYVELGCTVLAQAPHRAQTRSERALWTHSLPQLSWAVPALGAAVAAFGASYHSGVLDQNDSASKFAALKQYAHALQMLKQEPESSRRMPLPLVLACIVLACAEVMHHRPRDALTHLRGAFAIMSIHENWNSSHTDCDLSHMTASQDTQWTLDHKDEVSFLVTKLDLQKATYGGAPDLSLTSADSSRYQVGNLRELHEADHALCKTLNSCYRFVASAGSYKYKPASTVPLSFRIEQGRHIANLLTLISLLDRLVRQSTCNWRQLDIGSHGSYVHALVLRSQCLSALITTSTILDPYEKAYDRYALQFQQIIQAVEEVLRIDQIKWGGSSTLPPFTPEMGIIQPLFHTAEKYRDSTWRQRAIKLLQRAGREGPWIGKIEAAIAYTCACFEEKNAAGHESSTPILPEHVDEKDRLCGSSLDQVEQEPNSMLWAQIRLYKRRNFDALSGSDTQSERHWHIWKEKVGIP